MAGDSQYRLPAPAFSQGSETHRGTDKPDTERKVGLAPGRRPHGTICCRPRPRVLVGRCGSPARPRYVEAVRTGHPRHLAESQGFRWSPAFADSVARIWAGHLAASRLALSEGLVLHPVSGSHHAKRARGSGFCTFGYVVGASLRILDEGRIDRALLLDLDAHYGDGHDMLTHDDARFVHFDISAAGRRNIRRNARGVWIETASATHYLDSLRDELPALLDASRPGLVQYLAGVDAFEGDAVGGIRGMTAARLRDRDRYVLEQLAVRGLPAVISLAGGYSRECIALHLQTVREAVTAVRCP